MYIYLFHLQAIYRWIWSCYNVYMISDYSYRINLPTHGPIDLADVTTIRPWEDGREVLYRLYLGPPMIGVFPVLRYVDISKSEFIMLKEAIARGIKMNNPVCKEFEYVLNSKSRVNQSNDLSFGEALFAFILYSLGAIGLVCLLIFY